MNPIFKTIFLFLFSTSCFAQLDTASVKKRIWGLGIGALQTKGSNGLNVGVYGSVEKNKHFFALGVLSGRAYVIPTGPYQTTTPWTLTGSHAIYQFNPHPTPRRLNFFFEYQAMWFYQRVNGITYSSYNRQGIETRLDLTSIESYLGYGIRVKIFNRLSLNQSLGLGGGFTSWKTKYRGQSANPNEFFYRSLIVKLGLCISL